MAIDFHLLNQKPIILRYDILPFIFAYGALLMWYMSLDEEIIADEESILMMQIKKQTFENEILGIELEFKLKEVP